MPRSGLAARPWPLPESTNIVKLTVMGVVLLPVVTLPVPVISAWWLLELKTTEVIAVLVKLTSLLCEVSE